jgi:hypothetical protein
LQQKLQDYQDINTNKSKRKNGLLVGAVVLGLLLLIPYFAGTLTALYIARVAFLFLLVLFAAPWLIRRQQVFFLDKNKKIVSQIVDTLPTFKKRTVVAWQMVSSHKGFNKIRLFVTYAIWLNVFWED